MLFAYAGSLLAVERLFKIVKPKLMTLHWFAAAWKWSMSVRQKASQWGQLRYERSRNTSRSSLRLNRPENL